jgi:hypothetical protein
MIMNVNTKSETIDKGKKGFICIVSVFKNESHILEEWINHYLRQGIDHIFLTDNGSTDDYMDILNKYINDGIVTLNVNPTKFKQIEHINFFFNDTKHYEWTLICDLDEFIYGRQKYVNIRHYLSDMDNDTNCVFIPWKMYGSSGHTQQPNLVVPNFLKRGKYEFMQVLGKYAVRSSNVKKYYQHEALLYNYAYKLITSDGLPHKRNSSSLINVSEEILENSYIHCNHYAIQSWEWFKDVKMTRGDAHSVSTNSIRDENYFKGYDFDDIIDDELKNIDRY